MVSSSLIDNAPCQLDNLSSQLHGRSSSRVRDFSGRHPSPFTLIPPPSLTEEYIEAMLCHSLMFVADGAGGVPVDVDPFDPCLHGIEVFDSTGPKRERRLDSLGIDIWMLLAEHLRDPYGKRPRWVAEGGIAWVGHPLREQAATCRYLRGLYR
jgi:hypothetical protein